MRSEGGDWSATATGPGDTLRLRFTFEDWPDSRAFGTVSGQLVFTSPRGAVTCSSGNVILQRSNS